MTVDDIDKALEAITRSQGYIIKQCNIKGMEIEHIKPDSTLLKRALKKPAQAMIINEMLSRGLKVDISEALKSLKSL